MKQNVTLNFTWSRASLSLSPGDKTNAERREFMKELGDYVTNMFTNENIVNPDFGNFENIQSLGDEAAANNTNINAVMRQMAQEMPAFDFTMTDDIALDNIDFDNMAAGVQQQLNQTVYPAIADEVIKEYLHSSKTTLCKSWMP